MPDPGAWTHDAWLRHDRRSFVLALGLSFVLHAGVLAWRFAPKVGHAEGYGVITVAFRTIASPPSRPLPEQPPAEPESPPASAAQTRAEILTALKQTEARTVAAPKASPENRGVIRKPRSARAQPDTQAAASTSALPQAPPSARGVVATMTVEVDGHIGAIYWGELPALTDEQLKTLERKIRERVYPSGANVLGSRQVSEVIDVRAILNLPPARE